MIKSISVEEAALKTVQVEIRALIVSGKQMTLAVFRQLEYKNLLEDSTGNMNGVPWGWVNYFLKDQERAGANGALHAVWQDEAKLYRSLVFPSVLTEELNIKERNLSEFWATKYCILNGYTVENCYLHPEGYHRYASVKSNGKNFSICHAYLHSLEHENKDGEKITFDDKKLSECSLDELYFKYEEVLNKIKSIRENYATNFKTIKEKGQLFIAV